MGINMNKNFVRDVLLFNSWLGADVEKAKLIAIMASLGGCSISLKHAARDKRRAIIRKLWNREYTYNQIVTATGLKYQYVWSVINYNKKPVIRCIF